MPRCLPGALSNLKLTTQAATALQDLLVTVAGRRTPICKACAGPTLWTMGCVSPAASRKKTTERKKKSICDKHFCQMPLPAASTKMYDSHVCTLAEVPQGSGLHTQDVM